MFKQIQRTRKQISKCACLSVMALLMGIAAPGLSYAQQATVNPLAQHKDNWVGQYTGDELQLNLKGPDAQGVYQGSMSFKGKVYPVALKRSTQVQLSGYFTFQGNQFELSLSRKSNRSFELMSAGVKYGLTRIIPNDLKSMPVPGQKKTIKLNNGYEFKYPSSWSINPTQMGWEIIPEKMQTGKEYYLLNIEAMPDGMEASSDAFYKHFDQSFKSRGIEAQRVGGVGEYTEGDVYVFTYTYKNPADDMIVLQKYFVAIIGRDVIMLGSAKAQSLSISRDEEMAELVNSVAKRSLYFDQNQRAVNDDANAFQGGQTFNHPSGFTIDYPADWTTRVEGKATLLIPNDQIKNHGQTSESIFMQVIDKVAFDSLKDPKLVKMMDQLVAANLGGAQRQGQVQYIQDFALLPYRLGEGVDTTSISVIVKLHEGALLIMLRISDIKHADLRNAELVKMVQSFKKGNAKGNQQVVNNANVNQALVGSWFHEGGESSVSQNGSVFTNRQCVMIMNADGTLTQKFRSSVTVSVPGFGGGSNQRLADKDWTIYKGTWEVSGDQLILKWNEGNTEKLPYATFMDRGIPSMKIRHRNTTKPWYYKKTQ